MGDGMNKIPLAVEFRLPMADLDGDWYEGTQRYGSYGEHPDRCEDWFFYAGFPKRVEVDGKLTVRGMEASLVAPFDGLVTGAREYDGWWGMIVQVLGRLSDDELVCWTAAHLRKVYVAAGDVVRMGDPVGTIGSLEDWRPSFHYHEQISIGKIPAPWTFAADREFDFRRPSEFYRGQGVDAELIERIAEYKKC